MDQEHFITAIKMVVHDASIQGIETTLSRPSGRKPYKKLKELSAWFNGLPESDKKNTLEIIRLSVHASILNMLSVVDGVIAIESTPDKGEIKLSFVKDGKPTPLNDSNADQLHDIYQSQVQGEVFGIE